ncbi:MAG TPA: bifunctional [glutamate--ammonia ligase]-adenylyl-L-tyrosine phosphorylase/[glutamate--ammonia-ligase] adenylyltransferase [Zeimonas sp.]
MRFDGERHSAYFRRTLAAFAARSDEASARTRLAALAGGTLSRAAIESLVEHERALAVGRSAGVGGTGAAGVPVAEDDAALGRALRRARNWLMLALIERDIGGHATLEEVCEAMTAFAEIATGLAMRAAAVALVARHGNALDRDGQAQDLLAVGMGKVGGGELNVSSDLDLVFVFRGEGESAGAPGTGGGILATSEWMHRLARRTIALLSECDADGFVFRVDARLRPNGDSGPLVASLPMLEQYFYAQGREWERFAWLKGRVIADSGTASGTAREEDEAALARIVTPFVYRRYLDFDAIQALRELHAKVRAEVSRRGARDPEAFDVKLGRGGIREVEFIAQLFQIVRGGQDPTLQGRRTLETLDALAERGLLPQDESEALASAYRLLRRTEHMLQYREDAQTHRLARAPQVREAIAAMLGMPASAFDAAIGECTEETARIFDRLLAPPQDDGPAPEATDPPQAPDPGTARRFAALREGARYGAARADTRAAIDRLLAEAVRRGTGQAGLARLVDLLEAICRRPGYVALLDRFRDAFARVLRVLDWAKSPAEYLMQHPVVLDELLDGELLEPQDYAAWSEQLRERVEAATRDGVPDVERQMDLVREAHHAQVFRLMVQDLEGRLTVERLSDHLSELADRVLGLVIDLVWAGLRRRFRQTPRFAAISYGRLGGKELGYASDLDLVFLYEDPDERAPEAYALLAQRVSAWLSTRTAAGLLFETDLRLRPNGQAGMLVSSTAAFEAYQNEAAWVWEHQALTRARFSAGDASIGGRFESIRREVLARARDRGKLRNEVRAMRARMRDGHPNRSTRFDLKHDRGGMVDIEFIVQFLVLAHSGEHPPLLDNAGNIALLGRAADFGLIDVELARRTADAYRRYRRLQHQARLDGVVARVEPGPVAGEREAVRALWVSLFGAD